MHGQQNIKIHTVNFMMCLYVHPLVTAEARVLSMISPRGIFGGRCGTRTGFCSSGVCGRPSSAVILPLRHVYFSNIRLTIGGPLLGCSSNTLTSRQEINSHSLSKSARFIFNCLFLIALQLPQLNRWNTAGCLYRTVRARFAAALASCTDHPDAGD